MSKENELQNNKYNLKTIFGLSILYYVAMVAISFGTVFLEFSYTKYIDTEITWIFFLPWPSKIVEVNPVFFISGMVIDIVACLLLWRWHSSVLSKNAEEYTKGWRAGYTVMLVISVILCLLAEIAAYMLRLFDSQVKHGTILTCISFLPVPIIMIVLVIRRNRELKEK